MLRLCRAADIPARYVKIAVGRDYEDIAPIRGTYRGVAHCQMEVEVLVEQIP